MSDPGPTNEPASALDPEAAERRRVENDRATEQLRADFAHELGVSFGPHPAQRFDCYLPAGEPLGAVMVFLHGGGFRLGSPGPVAHYGRPILEHGGIFISLGYRLVPDLLFPDQVEDVELGLALAREFVADHGGDPYQLYLSGHSAGATLAAFASLRPRTPETEALNGLVLVSGRYERDLDRGIDNPQSRYFVSDLTTEIDQVPPHTIVVCGDRDLPHCLPQAKAITAAIEADEGSVEFFIEPDADHFQAIRGFATDDTPVSRAVLLMMGLVH